ncbi:MAG TPA: hypothetical protein VJC37_07825 [Planctomycetota bacterium]|nr:hypothetical protein [Planctomycetota bacterium]
MKYLVATLYLAAGIVLPMFYVNVVETSNILAREWILILALFVFCTIAGINLLFSINKVTTEEDSQPKSKPSPFKTPAQRKIPRPPARLNDIGRSSGASDGPVVTAPRYIEPTITKTRATGATSYPPAMEKPDINTLMEDIKNFIKLESWLMALQKANELIHYYPDSPETEKVRGNINFLIQKVKGHE